MATRSAREPAPRADPGPGCPATGVPLGLRCVMMAPTASWAEQGAPTPKVGTCREGNRRC